MALIVRDRIRDTTTTTGAATITLSGTAPLRYKNFASVLATNDTFPYAIVHQSVGVDEWEVGVGTLNSSTTFTRTTVVAGTNGTSAVVFSAGTKDVMMVDLADPLTLRTITGTAGQITVTNGDGVAGDPTISIDSALRTLPTVQVFTSGSGTYTTPANVKWIRVRLVGGGAGGFGSGTAAGTAPGAGGNTTFGTTLLAGNGGAVGVFATGAGGVGGTASLGTGPLGFAVQGGTGGSAGGNTGTTAVFLTGGGGGVSFFGGAGSGIGAAAVANSGSGGGGAGNANAVNSLSGSGGGSGGYVDAIINSPLATYAYAVGAAGTAGGAGTGGTAGGAGGSGFIIVEEYYNY